MPALVLALVSSWWLGACGFSGGTNNLEDMPDAGEPDGSPIADMDNDTVVDATDNCPTIANPDQADTDTDKIGNVCDNCPADANPRLATLTATGMVNVQRDHDGDGRGDVCDFCPHLASAAQDSDVDGDKIGTPCDPNDAVKNPPAEFNGFYDAPVVTDWNVPDAGSGNQSDWERVVTADNRIWWKQKVLDGGRHLLQRNRPAIDEVYVETLVRVHAVQAGGLRSAGVAMGYEFVSPNAFYFLCGVRHDTTSTENTIVASAYQNDTVDVAQTRAWNPVILEKDARLIGGTIRRSGGGGGDSTITCRGLSSDPVNDQATMVDSSLRPPGRAGLRTFGATASFDYLFIVDKAPALSTVR